MNPTLLFLILFFPLAGAAFNILFGMRLPRTAVAGIATGSVALSTAAALLLWPLSAEGTRATLYTWLASGEVNIPIEIVWDPLSASMTLMVTFVSTLIHLYAAGYMEEEGDVARFFALLNLFVFAMLAIVLADNLLLLYLGWEGVGFCSYGLIGFWYREEKNADAGRKAFLVTRVGDVFLAIALLWLFNLTGTLSITEINASAGIFPRETVFFLVLLLLAGACGKSAQLPLMTWLPDAMAGPTPVSALIHAATMVTAGVYLLCRLFPLVSLSPQGMAAIAAVGALTAFYAASCALAQREIKRVLAFSTMSQVGFMFLAVGAGTVASAMFHLFTHAFFKALLFMAAGCVIHLTGENDIYRMGGAGKKNPIVFWTFLAGALCLAGAPLTGGFFSKDEILLADFARKTPLYRTVWAIGTFTAFLTAFYTFRLFYLVFAGAPRHEAHGHRLPAVMTWTLPPLAVLAFFGGFINLPPLYGGKSWLTSYLGHLAGNPLHATHTVEIALALLATVLFFAGWLMARAIYRRAPAGAADTARSRFLLNGWNIDALLHQALVRPFDALAQLFWKGGDGRIIDGTLHSLADGSQSLGEALRRFTTGRLHTYAAGFGVGLVFILGWFLFEVLR